MPSEEVIAALSEDLFAHHTCKPLVDDYDVYQRLMDYCSETMQDDCHLPGAEFSRSARRQMNPHPPPISLTASINSLVPFLRGR